MFVCCKGGMVTSFGPCWSVYFTVDILRIGELYGVFRRSIRFVNALILTVFVMRLLHSDYRQLARLW